MTETISGIGNWKLTVQRFEDSVKILRAVSCDVDAVLPDELFGLPVTALEKRALAYGASPVKGGDELCIVCGRAEGEWSNKNIRSLTLPSGLKTVGDYAFMNCRSLHTIELHDGVDAIPSSAFMNCREFSSVKLRQNGDMQGPVLSSFVPWLSNELDVTITKYDGTITRLIFPEFYEAYTENEPTHFFNYTIEGVGYAYHHIFKNRSFTLEEYDALWESYFAAEHMDTSSVTLAWRRLRWPTGLSAAAEKSYTEYIGQNINEVTELVLSEKDMDGLRLLLKNPAVTEADIRLAQQTAREKGLTEATAILLEEQHRRFSSAKGRSFDF